MQREKVFYIEETQRKRETKMLKIMAIGNLTSDIELKKNGEGKPYAMLRIASDRRYKDREGNKLTDFISAKVRGPLAERCAAWGYKGAKVVVAGDFETITFVGEPGKQPGFMIKASDVQFLSGHKPANVIEFEAEVDERLYDEVV